ncbi:MAG: MFS transporter [Bacteroidetes bacterium]|nr:MFS transporter [Bacteroidota bacterium]
MKTGLGKLLQIDTGNRPMIIALMIQAGCTGLFTGALELAGNVMFLESFDVERVPLAIMISGGVGILITTIYSYFSKQLDIKTFGILNIVAVLVLTAALIIGEMTFARDRFSFLLFVLMGPLALIILLSFWITVRGFHSPSKGKQLSGLIEVALVAGMVIMFTAVPLLVMTGINIEHMLFAGLGCLIIAAGAQMYVLNGMDKDRIYSSRRVSSTGPVRLFSHRYTGLISAFVLFGISVAVVLQYMFLWSASDQFIGGSGLVPFLGFFFAVMMSVGWLMKRYLFGWIKKRYGIGMTMLMTPVLLLLFSLSALIVSDVLGLEAGWGMLPVFFFIVFLSRFVFGSWKSSMEDPSLNVIYQSFDPREKDSIRSGIEGVLSQIGIFSIGLFLALFVEMDILEFTAVPYVLILFVMAWFFVGLSLYRSYHKMLQVSLESDRIRDLTDQGLQELAWIDLKQTAFPIETIEFNPYLFHYTRREQFISMLEHSNPGVRIRIWDHLLASAPGLPQLTLSLMLTGEQDPVIKDRIRDFSRRKLRSKLGLQEAFIRERIDRFSGDRAEVDPAIGEAFHSGVRNEVFAALYHVASEHDEAYLPEVISLLKDNDLDVRSVAISTAGQVDSRRVTTNLIETLEHPQLFARGWSALVNQGELVLDELESAFHKPGSTLTLQKRIISVLSSIGGERAMQMMLEKLDYHHREVFAAGVFGLYENHFHASSLQNATVQAAILRQVQTGVWNFGAKISIRTENPGGYIAEAIDQEIWDVNETILMLLALIYDRRSVHRIRMNLLDKQAEDRIMAIELLELLLDDPLRNVLVSYFSDILIREKIDKLHSLYRVDLIPVGLLLKKVLNRDGMQMGDFIRICVLERMGNIPGYFDEQQIVAQGFHPNPKIRETVAQLLRKNDPGHYDMVTERLDFQDNSFPGHEDSARWYVNTTINLVAWKLFKNVGISSLFKLVSLLQPFSWDLIPGGDYVLLVRAVSAGYLSPLTEGIAIIAEHQPEILEQIRYLGNDGAREAYLVEREKFIELLFDDRSLLHVFCAFLNQNGDRLV